MDQAPPPVFYSGPSLSIANLQPHSIKVGEFVTISLKDGSLLYGPNYTSDAAARAFWEALSDNYRQMLRWKATHPHP